MGRSRSTRPAISASFIVRLTAVLMLGAKTIGSFLAALRM